MSTVSARLRRLVEAFGFDGNALDRLVVPGRRGPAPTDLAERLVLLRTVDTRGLAGLGPANVEMEGATVEQVRPLSDHPALPALSTEARDWLAELAAERSTPSRELDRWTLVITAADLPPEVRVALVDGSAPRAGFDLHALGPAEPPTVDVRRDHLNGIDALVVLDRRQPLSDALRQRVLLVRFVHAVGVDRLRAGQVRILGGVRVVDPEVLVAWPLWGIADAPLDFVSPSDRTVLEDLRTQVEPGEQERWLVVVVDEAGDHSPYTLSVVDGTHSLVAAPGFDPVLASSTVRFKVDCPSPFDCREPETPASVPLPEPPRFDYLARDFHGFSRLMRDRIRLLGASTPLDEHPASLQSTLIELVAFAADELSYLTDAVTTEAMLTTARRRTSVRRHARALDYRMHEGAAARAWVQLVAAEGIALDSRVLSPGAWFSTAVDGVAIHADAVDVEEAIRNGAEVFESLTPLDHLVDAHGEITVHAWGMDQAELPAGATEAILVDPGGEDARRLRLRRGDVVVFETTRGGASWRLEDADPTLRIAVRLVADPEPLTDPLLGEALLRIRWGTRDALPRAIPTRAWGLATAVARADIVLVSHGAPRVETGLRPELWGTGEWESGEGTVLLHLRGGDVAWRAPLQVPRPGPTSTSALGLPPGSPEWSARDLLEAEPRLATAAIRLFEDGSSDDWVSVPDLLDTDEGDLAVFVAEREEDGAVTLRFGDGVQGRRPPESAVFRAEYRQGGGPRGNLGAGALRHVYSDELASGLIAAVRQPLPAFGGAEPEDLRAVKILAPKAYRSQLRAVTLEDWAEVAGRHPEVQRAVARMHWTGTRHLVTVHVDRVGMRPVDEDFERELKAWLEPYRLTGYLLRVTGPVWVNLEVVLTVVCAPTAYRSEVGRALAQLFGAQVLPDGELGWFHPDRFTFGQEVYLSPIVARAMNVPGVEQVEASPADPRHRFRRSTEATDHLDTGRLELDELEVARCESDPSAPERGYISFILEGGA